MLSFVWPFQLKKLKGISKKDLDKVKNDLTNSLNELNNKNIMLNNRVIDLGNEVNELKAKIPGEWKKIGVFNYRNPNMLYVKLPENAKEIKLFPGYVIFFKDDVPQEYYTSYFSGSIEEITNLMDGLYIPGVGLNTTNRPITLKIDNNEVTLEFGKLVNYGGSSLVCYWR